MKKSILLLTLIFISMSVYSGEECSTTLKQSDNYKSLNLTLKCLNNRIDMLEQILNSKTSINSDKELFFENDFLFVSISSISISNDKRQIVLSLKIKNTSKEDIYLVFDRSSAFPSLAGNDGSFLTSQKMSGLPIEYGANLKRLEKYSKITAGKKSSVNLVFYSNKEIEATEFSFSSEFSQYIEKKPDTFSMGISNIPL